MQILAGTRREGAVASDLARTSTSIYNFLRTRTAGRFKTSWPILKQASSQLLLLRLPEIGVRGQQEDLKHHGLFVS